MIGLSMTAYNEKTLKSFEEWVKAARELGFDFIELVSEWPHYLTRDNISFFREVLGSYGMKATVHAPFSDLNIASFNERIRKASLEIIRDTIELSAELGALAVTIHPGHCSPVSVKNRGEYLQIHRESLRRIARWSEEYGVKVGVENMPRFPILDAQNCDRLAEIIEGIEIRVTFDVGHLNTTTRNFDRFLGLFGRRIVHVHLHDNSGNKDEHLPVGDGIVPWKEVLPKLPPVTRALEVNDLESARRSLEFLKSLH
ncbi:sugar phosphate isomerase/epimerase family protein [Thermococcus gorgonarius]|uniref:Xylose isomerase n=1 Tax=Thermococcus gorgonarius TaxID=71997 RepID=A0A2Z2MF22_THEGO|nr:sugar phosphate isomerase/epimerase family protein [Thermococcus gorgonarius]ASJ00598.1 xylose isomerase [Thermococcus gorgonarius]